MKKATNSQMESRNMNILSEIRNELAIIYPVQVIFQAIA